MKILDLIRKILEGSMEEEAQPKPAETVMPDEPVETAEPISEETPVPKTGPLHFPQEMLAITCIGESHIKQGTVCQDSSLCYQAENYRMIVVSDGHGSASFPRSDRGSRLACSVTRDVCAEFAANQIPQDKDQAAREICEEILRRWTEAVLADYREDPFDEACLEQVPEKYREHYRTGNRVEHAYGATLIAVFETPAGILALRCGDGECVKIDQQGVLSRPIPWNEKCDVNVTTSLCDNDAINEFRWVWLEDAPAAIWISTDGLDNSYTVAAELDEFYANLSLLAVEEECGRVRQELEKFLPVLTQRCSRDDISVAALLDTTRLVLAQDRLHAYVQLQRSLREREKLQRRIRKLEQVLRDKKRKAGNEEISWEDTEEAKEQQTLSAQLGELEEKIRQLRLATGELPQ